MVFEETNRHNNVSAIVKYIHSALAIVLWVKSMLMSRILISDRIALHEYIMRKDNNNYSYEITLANGRTP